MGYIGKQPAKVPLTSEDIVDDSIESADIKEGTIVNSDINASAGIVISKLAVDPTNADNISSGTLPDARLPATLPAKSGVNLTALNATNLGSGTVASARLGTGSADATKFLRGDGSWQVVSVPLLDSPVITGTLSVLPSGAVTHTISNWSDDVSYTITPTNCTAGAVNGSGEFIITHTSGTPSYTILATTASLGLDDSALVTKNITLTLTAPTLSSPANVGTAADVVYTITSTDSNDDKLILDPGTANFTYQSESGPGTASKVGNTVECVGFGTGNPVVTIQFTAEATYSVTAKAVKIDGTYTTSANSSADSITILNTYNIDYLVIAGGGGGGGHNGGGGGGAGGYRSSWNSETSGGGGSSETAFVATPATVYTITVGGGGAGTAVSTADGTAGQNSVFATITSIGGGFGGGNATDGDGGVGGSGGGAGRDTSTDGGAGTSLQGRKGGDFDGAGGSTAGGGGGASVAAVNVTGSAASAGGAGVASSITTSGSTVTRAGGGGGGCHAGGTGAAGGAGGGGVGGGSGGTAGTGTTNYGSGGGGAGHVYNYTTSAAGGSGVVILRIPDANYSGTTSGSPTVDTSTSGSETILIFNDDGTYTA